jgi:hypothetical protein
MTMTGLHLRVGVFSENVDEHLDCELTNSIFQTEGQEE